MVQYPECAHRARHVLDLDRTEVIEAQVETVANGIPHRPADQDIPGRGALLQARGDVRQEIPYGQPVAGSMADLQVLSRQQVCWHHA